MTMNLRSSALSRATLAALTAAAVAPLLLLPSQDAEARTCTLSGRVCADSADRVIAGETVSKECWRWEETYTCVSESPEAGRCSAASLPATCSVVEEVCSESDDVEGCIAVKKDLLCTEEPSGAGITVDDPVITIAYSYAAESGAALDASGELTDLGDGCSVTFRTCTDTTPREISVENISGETVTASPACWREVLTVSCPSAGAASTCKKLEAAGCEKVSDAVCAETDSSGTCTRWTASYKCTGTTVDGDGITEGDSEVLPDGGVIVDDSACTSAVREQEANGLSCSETARTCAVEGETVTAADGSEVSIACKQWDVTYTCSGTGTEGCAALEKLAESGTCTLESEPVCEATNAAGECIKSTAVYRCGAGTSSEDAGEAVELGTVTEVEATPVDTCSAYEANTACAETAKTCTDGPGIKYVDGEPVYRDCWTWTHTYTCPMAGEDECQGLEKDSSCRLVSESCPEGETDCPRPTRVYECVTVGTTTTTGTACSGQTCIAGVCMETDDDPDEDFATTMVEMEIARQAGVYGDVSADEFFSGIAIGCRDRYGASSCCREDTTATLTNSSAYALSLQYGLDAGVQLVKYLGSPFVYDLLAYSDKTAGLLKYLYGDAPNGVYNPSFSYWGATLSYSSATGWTFEFSPGGFAIAAAMKFYGEWSSCRAEDQRVAMMKGQRLCRYLGTICTKHTAGLGCTEREERYMCFNSKLARIINEQGRPQLGRGWGTAEVPDTRGFTADELAELDFSAMDFSEFVADIVREALSSGTVTEDYVNDDAVIARAEERVSEMLSGTTAVWGNVAGSTGAVATGAATSGSTEEAE
ncbi:conjugal transfer protein TraN [Sutterella sp.]|uniref:conjugal transfer protein TraN n=1 Tax=Sutterella sp. TaxID=1981025 RepID=UPI0026E0D179|nr:conjugal transfer protein TraN [Sutterella sp.]MDO5531897.1 conjugal transfer protein TraN [Sutterella sp.]